MTLRRITRDRPLASEEAAKDRKVRADIAAELQELIERHHQRMARLLGKERAAQERKSPHDFKEG